MIKIKDIGQYEKIPPIVNDIITGNIPALNEYLKQGWNIEKNISLCEYTEQSPLDFALIMESFNAVKWLVEQGVNLNVKYNPSFLTAVRYCNEDIIRYIVAHGAKINKVNNVKSEAFQQAIYGKRCKNLSVIHELGHTVERYAGEAFRTAVSDANYDALAFFISHHVDINYNKADMVYPFKPTPLCIAARYINLEMCKYLVKHGANPSLAEKGGMRPYSIAIEKGDKEMADYFKSIEPAEFHNLNNKLAELKPYKLSKTLIDFLQRGNLHIDLPDSDFEFIEFFSLIETIPFKVAKQKLLRLSKTTGDYADIIFVWNPKSKKLAYYDLEHEELGDLCTFEDFLAAPDKQLEKIF